MPRAQSPAINDTTTGLDEDDQMLLEQGPVRDLTDADIEAIDDSAERPLTVRAWKGRVWYRPLTVAEMNHIYKVTTNKQGDVDVDRMNALFLSRSLTRPKISYATALGWLQRRDGRVMQRILGVLKGLAEPSEEDVAEAESFPAGAPADAGAGGAGIPAGEDAA
jgi:hypothetical protein